MTGYCPHCGKPLSALTVAAKGYCEIHGWQWADWASKVKFGWAPKVKA